jgi:hypothetical protein
MDVQVKSLIEKTLILPDIHNRIDKVRGQINVTQPSKIIFLGDAFHSFDDRPIDMVITARFIIDELCAEYGENFIWLAGNHDVPHLFPGLHHSCYCSGFSHEKQRAVQPTLNSFDWSKNVKFIHEENNWWFSHAGLSRWHFEHAVNGMPDKSEILSNNKRLFKKSKAGLADIMIGAGVSRYGNLPVGGITWQDWREKEVIEGFNEVVGHSIVKRPQYLSFGEKAPKSVKSKGLTTFDSNDKLPSKVINLDTNSLWFGILDETKLTVVNSNQIAIDKKT